jgi:tRNA threonylcarbamoyladenosine biosynthesis protein TsaE
LVSDLGGGKTTFTRGLVRGAGSGDKVASPSFTISKVYTASHFEVHHFDFYRLQEAGVIANELAEVVGDPKIVTVIEWAKIVQHILPEKHLTLTITQAPDGSRELIFAYPQSLGYLMEGLR